MKTINFTLAETLIIYNLISENYEIFESLLVDLHNTVHSGPVDYTYEQVEIMRRLVGKEFDCSDNPGGEIELCDIMDKHLGRN